MTPGDAAVWPSVQGAQEAFGRIDIYVFDQILRGNITSRMRVLDAGCGGGRNAEFLLRCGADVHGVDSNADQVERMRAMAAEVAPSVPADNFGVADLADLPFPDAHFGAVICSAVLHFSRDEDDFRSMVSEMWRVLEPGGIFFARLASTMGVEPLIRPKEGRWHHLPDGSDRFLVNEALLMEVGAGMGGDLVDPLKTTIVQGKRSMTTWVLRKA